MKRTVKSLLPGIVISTLSHSSYSKPRLPLANALASDIRKIIREYPHQFNRLQGNIIEENPQTTTYDCNFKVTGAQTSSITKFSSNKRKVYTGRR